MPAHTHTRPMIRRSCAKQSLPCEGRKSSTPPCSTTLQPQRPKSGFRVCPALFHLSTSPHFSPRPTAHVRPASSQIRLFPFCDRFNTLQPGPRPPERPVPGRYDLSPFVHLSVAPQTQAGPRSSRHGPPGKHAPHNSSQFKPGAILPLVLHVPMHRLSLTTHRAAPRMAPPLRSRIAHGVSHGGEENGGVSCAARVAFGYQHGGTMSTRLTKQELKQRVLAAIDERREEVIALGRTSSAIRRSATRSSGRRGWSKEWYGPPGASPSRTAWR